MKSARAAKYLNALSVTKISIPKTVNPAAPRSAARSSYEMAKGYVIRCQQKPQISTTMRNLLPILLLCLVAGCQGKSISRHQGNFTYKFNENGMLTLYEVRSANNSLAEAPPDAQEPSSTEAGFGISRGVSSGSRQAAPIDWAAKNSGWLYIIGAVALIGGVVVAVWLKQKTLGIALGVAGGVLIAAPSQLNNLGWMLTASVGVLLLGGFAWIAIQLFRKQQAAQVMPNVVKKLHTAIHADTLTDAKIAAREGVTALRAAVPAVNREFEAQAK